MGKAIYQPKGKAGEYSEWACNFYVGCSNGCEYCYCKKGILKYVMGMDKPQLKKCFKDEQQALEVFEKELKANLSELQKHGLFFSFTTDPMLPETIELTKNAIAKCLENGVPVKTLTKVEKIDSWFIDNYFIHAHNDVIAFGFTLTGHDELEPNASTNQERIEAIKKLYDAGFKTFASIEPIIDFKSSMGMIIQSYHYCDLFKIGLESGKKYDKKELLKFINTILAMKIDSKIYFKDSLLKATGIDRADLHDNCVDRDYNMFE